MTNSKVLVGARRELVSYSGKAADISMDERVVVVVLVVVVVVVTVICGSS